MRWCHDDGCCMEWSVDPACDRQPPSQTSKKSIPIQISVTPYIPNQTVNLEYRINRGPILCSPALPAPAEPNSKSRRFQAILPGDLCGRLEYLPVLLLDGQHISPRLELTPPSITVLNLDQQGASIRNGQTKVSGEIHTHLPRPQWGWESCFLGSLKARLRKELVGPTPDGLRINWHVVEGNFVGPDLEARICSGATDWMRILPNGIGIVDVKATFETANGSLIFGTYGGIFDLGPNGYQQVLEDRADPNPPVVVTPTYVTAAPELAWMNRLQCIGVGRVDMKNFKVSFDVYRISIGDRIPC